MSIDENLSTFAGKPVRDYDPEQGIRDPTGTVYRLRIAYDDYDNYLNARKPAKRSAVSAGESTGFWGNVARLFGAKPPATANQQPAAAEPEEQAPDDEPFVELLAQFTADFAARDVPALVVGDWGQAGAMNDSCSAVRALVAHADRLPNLRALFLGDIMMEESEMSWITHGDLSPLYAAFPRLEHLQIRGAEKLSLGDLTLPGLKTLIIESGGLGSKVVQQVFEANLPNLEHLELWLGTDDYGGDTTVEDLEPLLDGVLFPKLSYLGLRDYESVDALAQAIGSAPILDRIKVLDLSLGNLSDEGGEALLASPKIRQLEKLDLHHHYLSDDMIAKFKALGIEVDLSERQEADEDGDEIYRYIAVSE